jgi:YD repeat-containing protein
VVVGAAIKSKTATVITSPSLTRSWGEIKTITDTLGRVLTFNYDGNDNLQSITQTWGGQTHEWATFGWGTANIGNNFPGLNNLGPNSTTIPVLTQVGLPDGSRYNFEYNNSYDMVSKIRHHASDDRLRRQTTYVAPASATDCPRLTERRDWAENWNGDTGDGVATANEEAVTSFAHDADGGCRITLPDGTVQKEYYGSSWQSGLTTETRSYATAADANSNSWQKRTVSTWTQDNPNVSYFTHPRVTETNVYDASNNRRRTTIDYSVPAYAQYGLPYIVREYAADATTILRETYTDYNLNQSYLDYRIIGLVSAVHMVSGSYQAKVTYGYDDPTRLTSQATTATMHDQNYDASFTLRGNVTSVSRWDTTNMNTIVDPSKALTTQMNYNAAGSVLSATDPADHTNSIGYTDAFSDNINRNTFAYPTTVTDADGFNSSVQYNYDFGAKTRVQTPLPNVTTNQPGPVQTFEYDNAVRLQRITSLTNGAYTHYEYGPNYLKSYSTVNNVAADYHNADLYSAQVLDGLGRVIIAGSNHPGSTGGYRAVHTIYGSMGRTVQQSNPTETNADWVPAGDDAIGWQYNNPTVYDWKGRALKAYNMDGTFKEASYSGCGCAGGQAVTLTDEVGRQQKAYSDVLGRAWKTEVLNWPDGGGNRSVYSTSVSVYDARDQIKILNQYSGSAPADASSTNESVSCPDGTCQKTSMTFDGYGRLQTKHVPEQNAGTATMYAYNADDTIQSVTDARGASASYIYNNQRHHVNEIHYNAPTGITPTSNITFGYDAAGNRTSMSNSNSSVTYHYDQMSRMDREERTFSGLSGLYRLSYGYNLAGQLATLNQPSQFGTTVTYTHDAAGRLTDVTGSGYGTTTQFATGLQYRAWGAVKHANYGSGAQLNLTHNSRLLVTRYELSNLPPTGYPPQVSPMGTQNQFYADGRIQYAQDLQNGNFDRAYEYDHVARLHHATSGREARGLPPVFPRDNPFHQNYSYDAWNNMARPTVQHWSAYLPPDTPTYINNRRADWGYNANGQVVSRDTEQKLQTYDAAGQTVHYWEQIYHPGSEETWFNERNTVQQTYDGDAHRIRRQESREVENVGGSNTQSDTTYYLTSSVLGGAVVTEINGLDLSRTERIYANGEMIATHWSYSPQIYNTTWRHVNGVTGVWVNSHVGSQAARNELDPLGSDVGTADPYVSYSSPSYSDFMPISLYEERGNPFDPSGGCGTLDGLPISCSELGMRMQGGSVATEWEIPERQRSTPPTLGGGAGGHRTVLNTYRWPIVDQGVGLFMTLFPRIGGGSAVPGNNNEGYHLDWSGRVITVPQNTPQPQITPCDRKFASIFGDSNAVGRTAYDYNGRYRGLDPAARARTAGLPRSDFSSPVWDAEHLYNFPHLSGNLAGTENADIYVPGNYTGRPTGPTKGDAIATFYYKNFFGMKNVTLAVFHVGNFGTERMPDGSVRIGTTGGPGGNTPGSSTPNLHSHFELWRGRGYRPPGAGRDAARIPLTPVICK